MCFTTPRGTFVWVVIPFSLSNVPATFERLVMYIFTNLFIKFMTMFLDDFDMQSSANQYLECVKETLMKYRKMQLALNSRKIFLGV